MRASGGPANPVRVPPGVLKQLGPINWGLCRLLSAGAHVPDVHLFSTLGRTRGLFRAWLYYSARLMPGGHLQRRDTELVILRVAHLRSCAYETDHHIRIAARAGITPSVIDQIHTGPSHPGWRDRDRALLAAVDALVRTDAIDDVTWRELARHYDERDLVEIVLLVTQYDGLATIIATLGIRPDR